MSARPREYPPALAADDHADDVVRDWYRYPDSGGWVLRYFIRGDGTPYRSRTEALQVLAATRDRRSAS